MWKEITALPSLIAFAFFGGFFAIQERFGMLAGTHTHTHTGSHTADRFD